jgi:tetrapyrrole methylase family protein/MazG family protein
METLRTHLLEETYEVLEAIDAGRRDKLREELGDLLFQITFLAQLASEERAFDVEEVAGGIVDKLVRRHPHVFGDAEVTSAEEALQQWEVLKASERGQEHGSPGALSGVPRQLPALLKAFRLTNKASQLGFDWTGPHQVMEKLQEELEEFRCASEKGDRQALEEELGDLLFTLANLGRHLALDPEVALQRANQKFIQRFEHLERALRESGRTWETTSAEDLDQLWERAKREV